jgi:hypothetical protein
VNGYLLAEFASFSSLCCLENCIRSDAESPLNVACTGKLRASVLIDRRVQANVLNLLRTDTPQQFGRRTW